MNKNQPVEILDAEEKARIIKGALAQEPDSKLARGWNAFQEWENERERMGFWEKRYGEDYRLQLVIALIALGLLIVLAVYCWQHPWYSMIGG